MMATVTIVDEVSRASSKLLSEVVSGDCLPSQWNNAAALNAALGIISDASVDALSGG
jgi:phosphopantothenate synthetase